MSCAPSPAPPDIAALRDKADTLNLGPVEAQRVGADSDVELRLNVQPGGEAAQSAAVQKLRDAFGGDYDFRSVEAVGPRVSGELVQSGTLGVVVAILAVLTYLWFRFEWQFAIGAIIGTMHDLLLTVGFLLRHAARVQPDFDRGDSDDRRAIPSTRPSSCSTVSAR